MNDSSSPIEPSAPPPVAAPGVQPEHPPRPPLVLRVGVVGHRPDPKKRPDPDVAALREICRQLLRHVQDAFAIHLAHMPGIKLSLPSSPPNSR